jgi:hypothetical protein
METLSVPQYNPANHFGQPLTGVTVNVTSAARGTYTLINIGNSVLRYGRASSDVGAELSITANGLPALNLEPFPMQSIGMGELTAPPSPGFPVTCPNTPGSTCRLETTVMGSDTESVGIAPANFGLFTGSGFFTFAGEAFSFIDVSKSGSGIDFADIEADLTLEVVYTFDDPPSSVNEPYLGILSLFVLGFGGYCLKSRSV